MRATCHVCRVLLPTIFDAHGKIDEAYDHAAYVEAGTAWPLLFTPAEVISIGLSAAVWTAGATFFLADTYMWCA